MSFISDVALLFISLCLVGFPYIHYRVAQAFYALDELLALVCYIITSRILYTTRVCFFTPFAQGMWRAAGVTMVQGLFGMWGAVRSRYWAVVDWFDWVAGVTLEGGAEEGPPAAILNNEPPTPSKDESTPGVPTKIAAALQQVQVGCAGHQKKTGERCQRRCRMESESQLDQLQWYCYQHRDKA